jgi:hypothetical protein
LIEDVIGFLHGIGEPVCISDLGIEVTDENKEIILKHIYNNGFDKPDIYKRILKGFDCIWK